MTLQKIKEYEHSFLQLLSSPQSYQEFSIFSKLTPESRHRLKAYKESYQDRIIKTLQDSFLDRVCKIAPQYCKKIVTDFVFTRHFHQSMLDQCITAFAIYLNEIDPQSEDPILELMHLCLAEWNLLKSFDPPISIQFNWDETQLNKLYLNPHHYYRPSQAPVYQLWKHCESTLNKELKIANNPETIIMFKSSKTEIVLMNIEDKYKNLIEALSNRSPLLQALRSCEFTKEEDLNELTNFIHYLHNQNAFIYSDQKG